MFEIYRRSDKAQRAADLFKQATQILLQSHWNLLAHQNICNKMSRPARQSTRKARPDQLPDDAETEDDNSKRLVLAAVLENRAQEVGLAVLDKSRMRLELCQFVEGSRTFTTTSRLLDQHQPAVVLVVASAAALQGRVGGLAGVLARFQQVPLVRAYFDDTRGATKLEEYCSKESCSAADSLTQGQLYLALGWPAVRLH